MWAPGQFPGVVLSLDDQWNKSTALQFEGDTTYFVINLCCTISGFPILFSSLGVLKGAVLGFPEECMHPGVAAFSPALART